MGVGKAFVSVTTKQSWSGREPYLERPFYRIMLFTSIDRVCSVRLAQLSQMIIDEDSEMFGRVPAYE